VTRLEEFQRASDAAAARPGRSGTTLVAPGHKSAAMTLNIPIQDPADTR
jgi:hypothetical protein